MKILHTTHQFPRFALFLSQVRSYTRNSSLDFDASGRPTLQYDGHIFTGFRTTGADLTTYQLFRHLLPKNLPSSHYRLMRDFITRYVYPHMMPAEVPTVLLPAYFLGGFHGQHKDSISTISDKVLRREVSDVFKIRLHDVIINGGAYLGFGDLRVAPLNSKGRILAIEAAHHCFELLCHNISTNGLDNIFPIHCALWNCRGQKSLGTSSFQANTLVPQETRNRENLDAVKVAQFETVETIPIDDLVDSYKLERVDFVNLTLNGAEVEALEGMQETMAQFKPRIRLAGWYVRDRPIWQICQDVLLRFNYRVVIGARGNVFGLPK